MRRLILALAMLAAPAVADVSATITSAEARTAGVPNMDARITRARAKNNAAVCASVTLPSDCTSAQVTASGKTPTGAYYTTNDAYAKGLLVKALLDATASAIADDAGTFCVRWRSITQAERDALCQDPRLNLPAGCEACP